MNGQRTDIKTDQVNIFALDVLLEKFLYYLEFEKNNSPKTLENYSLWLNRFVSYIYFKNDYI